MMKMQFRFLIAGIVFCAGLQTANLAHAGLMDKLNAATQKLNNYSQNVEQRSKQMENAGSTVKSKGKAQTFEKTKTSNPLTGEWGNQVTCAGPNSATCQNGMDNLINCTHQSKGYYYRLVAANLEEKAKDSDWSDEDRSILRADIESLKAAIETDKVIDPDPNEPQRYLTFLNEEDQQEINRLNITYINEVRTDCDKRFGGMSQFSH